MDFEHVDDCEEYSFTRHGSIEFKGATTGNARAGLGEDLGDEAGEAAGCALRVCCWGWFGKGVGGCNERGQASVTEVPAEQPGEACKGPEEEVAADEFDKCSCERVWEFVDTG